MKFQVWQQLQTTAPETSQIYHFEALRKAHLEQMLFSNVVTKGMFCAILIIVSMAFSIIKIL